MSVHKQSLKQEALELGKRAKNAARQLAPLSSEEKNKALLMMADQLEAQSVFLIEENEKDLEFANKAGASSAVLDRIALNPSRVNGMAKGLREVAALPDPVREVIKMWRRPNGLQVGRMRIPLGVIGIIYEARPNVTADAAALCLKSGNAVILRGGSEAHHSNQAIGAVLRQACAETRVPQDAVQVVERKDHALVNELLQLEEYIDLIIPRGGEELIRAVVASSKIPVIKHYKGVCHVYVDNEASLEMAERICFNAKVQRPSVCNAMETLLVHEGIAPRFLPTMIAKFQSAGVEIRGCENTRALVSGVKKATDTDWSTEYLDLILAVRVVKDMDEAIDHIERYGSEHTESIVTTNYQKSREFIDRVNSSAVMVNASTRFNDGGELGLGAEIG
ncbi:MAG TPA: glutamate-5-semialdehyde dehydrogenase, partial [Verrucomicrobiae bacterium]|nr:glutamate-5-semialdehyde dehydrogenase [Verrucomicrobiae bacterium]